MDRNKKRTWNVGRTTVIAYQNVDRENLDDQALTAVTSKRPSNCYWSVADLMFYHENLDSGMKKHVAKVCIFSMYFLRKSQKTGRRIRGIGNVTLADGMVRSK
jgi:hypothetical protein